MWQQTRMEHLASTRPCAKASVFCGITGSIHLVFVPCSWHTAAKALSISGAIGTSSVLREDGGLQAPELQDGAGGQKDQGWQGCPPHTLTARRGGGWTLMFVTSGQRSNQLQPCKGTSVRPPKPWGSRAFRLVNTPRCQEGGVPAEEALHAPHLTPCVSSVWLFLSCILQQRTQEQ